MRNFIALAGMIVLAGCGVPPETRCQQMGAEPGTSDFWQCVQGEEANASQRMQAAAAIMGAMPRQQPYVGTPYQIPVNRPWNATCNRVGSYTYCNGN